MPFPDARGGVQMVESQVDTTLTQKIAEITGGQFYRATGRLALEQIYDQIDTLEKTKAESQSIIIRKSLFQYPLAAALILLMCVGLTMQMKRDVYDF